MKTYYKLKSALKKAAQVEDLCIFLSEIEAVEDLEKLSKFSNLKRLSLLDGKWLTALPNAVFELNNLEEFRIRNTAITRLTDDLGKLKKLKVIQITETPLGSLPSTIGQLKQLEELHLRGIPLKNLPLAIGELKKLVGIKIKTETLLELPATIGKCSSLERLFVDGGNELNELPISLVELKQLKRLCVTNTKLSELPKGWEKIGGNLILLDLSNNELEQFPTGIHHCKKLTHLYVSKNQIKSIPAAIGHLEELVLLRAQKNPITALSTTLLKWYTMENATHRNLFFVDDHLYRGEEGDLIRLLNHKVFKALPFEDKEHYFHLYNNIAEQISKLPQQVIRGAINAKISIVADHAVQFLTQNAVATLSPNSCVLVLGKLTQSRKDLATKLEPLGIRLVSKMTAEYTHVLISSRSNKRIDKLPKETHWQWLTEAQVMTYIDEFNPSFLVESAQTEEDSEMVARVQALILTLEEENMALAVELVAGGGLPAALLTEMFIVYKLAEEASTREKAKRILAERADTSLKNVLRSRSNLRKKKAYYTRSEHKKMTTTLLKYANEETPIDLGKLAYAVYMRVGTGIPQALSYTSGDLQKNVLQKIIGKSLWFNLDYYNGLDSFPEQLTAFTHLKGISIYGNRSSSKPFVIPDTICNLTALEELHIRYVTVEKVSIAALAQCQNLRSLHFRAKQEIKVEELQQLLPKCKIVIQ